jgi:hypothetical protein
MWFDLAVDSEWSAGGRLATPVSEVLDDLWAVFLTTLIYALPGACLYLPIIGLKDAEERRIWLILISGTLIGPVSMALWCLFFQYPLTGMAGRTIMVYATVVGSLTALFYAIALKVDLRRSRKPGRSWG